LAEIVRRKNRQEAGRLNLKTDDCSTGTTIEMAGPNIGTDSGRSTLTGEGRVLMGQEERRVGSVDSQEIRSSGFLLDVELNQSTDETAGCCPTAA
jgi:hypothetical protein